MQERKPVGVRIDKQAAILLLVLSVEIVAVGEAHRSKAMIPDPDLVRAIRGFVEKNVYRVAVLMEQRCKNLE